jgi:hypothetical protein
LTPRDDGVTTAISSARHDRDHGGQVEALPCDSGVKPERAIVETPLPHVVEVRDAFSFLFVCAKAWKR